MFQKLDSEETPFSRGGAAGGFDLLKLFVLSLYIIMTN